jgi:predicted acyltransferase
MVFVNDISGVVGTPAWLKHFPPGGDGMTIVDLVFPGFLFVMGMSIPVALGKRLGGAIRTFSALPHVFMRTAVLLVIGVFMVNNPGDSNIGWRAGLWSLLMYASVFFAWHTIPSKQANVMKISTTLRWTGLLALILLAVMFRDAEGRWLRTQWWGILGLIGWAYLIASATYLVFRNNRTGLLGTMALLFCVYAAYREGLLDIRWVGGSAISSLPAIAVGGVFLGTLVYDCSQSARERWMTVTTFILFSAAAAWLLRPLYGIGKNPATLSWCLWSIAITTAVWAVLHVFVDIGNRERPLRPFRLLGMNPLFAYLLAPLFYSVFEVTGIGYFNLGTTGFAVGLARSLVFTLVIGGIAAWAARGRVRLKI